MITIDGIPWEVPCSIDRTAEVRPSEISGMLLDKNYFNDVIGTYMQYDVTLAVPPTMHNEYATLYETLTEPVDGHSFTLPYNDGTLALTARVSDVRDRLVLVGGERQLWRGVKFTVTANHPTKTMTFGETILRGMTEVPDITIGGYGGQTYRCVDGEYF